jgi:hypothetical protein
MRRRQRPDPFTVLGLPPTAGVDDVEAARRRLAKSAHPDVGGSLDAMQRINAAADDAVRLLMRTSGRGPASSPGPRPAPPPAGGGSGRASGGGPRFARRDHPSFTIEALPVEAFEGLLIVAGWLGDLIDDDPPYALEVAMTQPYQGWCRLDLVPDAGASTVSLVVAGEPGAAPPDIDAVRDAWIGGLNQLDWADLGSSPPTP